MHKGLIVALVLVVAIVGCATPIAGPKATTAPTTVTTAEEDHKEVFSIQVEDVIRLWNHHSKDIPEVAAWENLDETSKRHILASYIDAMDMQVHIKTLSLIHEYSTANAPTETSEQETNHEEPNIKKMERDDEKLREYYKEMEKRKKDKPAEEVE